MRSCAGARERTRLSPIDSRSQEPNLSARHGRRGATERKIFMTRIEWLGVLSIALVLVTGSGLGCVVGDKPASETTEADSGAAKAQLVAPVLSDVMAMGGSLHISWTVDGACDQIEAERKTAAAAYATEFTETAAKGSHVDASATADMTYTYRLRCKVGEDYSEYSNEKSGNPTK